MLQDIDFSVYINKLQVKGFLFRNEDDTYYDFTGSTVKMMIYYSGSDVAPTEYNGSISTSTVSFTLPALDLSALGNYEYVIEETKSGGEIIPLLHGNIEIKNYVPFSSTIEAYLISELPVGFILDDNFLNQKTRYWRLFLQDAFDISDGNLTTDSKWPELVNVLIAKIIAYESLIMAIKGNLINVLGSSTISTSTSSTSGDIKSIETGPSKVEFYAAGETMSQIIKNTTSGGDSNILSTLSEDLCGLANKLTVKIPMCKAGNFVKTFQFYKNPDLSNTVADQIIAEDTPSRG